MFIKRTSSSYSHSFPPFQIYLCLACSNSPLVCVYECVCLVVSFPSRLVFIKPTNQYCSQSYYSYKMFYILFISRVRAPIHFNATIITLTRRPLHHRPLNLWSQSRRRLLHLRPLLRYCWRHCCPLTLHRA